MASFYNTRFFSIKIKILNQIFIFAPLATFTIGEAGVDACPDTYKVVSDIITCKSATSALGLEYSTVEATNDKGVCVMCGGCNGNEKDTVRMRNSHGPSARWICEKSN